MPGSFENPDDRAQYFKDVVNKGERKGQTRGSVIGVPLPSREKWNAMLAAHAPGCGSPTPVPGTGGEMACGARLDGKQVFCPHCRADEVVEQLLEADEPEEFLDGAEDLANIDLSKFDAFEVHPFNEDGMVDTDDPAEIQGWAVYGHSDTGLHDLADFSTEAEAYDAVEFLEQRMVRLGKMVDTFQVHSSHGEFVVNPDGDVVDLELYEPVDEDGENLRDIAKFDVNEWAKHHKLKRVPRAGSIDILDIGYWTKTGYYEPPEADWRDRHPPDGPVIPP